MNLTPRPFGGPDDLHAMDAILIAGAQRGGPGTAYIHPGDMRWWLYYHFPGEELWSNIYLWEAPEKPAAAWTLFSPKEESFELFYLPELNGSAEMRHMLAWSSDGMARILRSEGVAQVQKLWNHPNDRALCAALEDLGFTRSDQIGVDLFISLDNSLPPPQLPPGFSVRAVRGLEELENRAAAQHSAFESDLPMERYLQRFQAYMTSPAYVPEQDVVAVAPDGRIAAFARLWPDATLRCGNFEPVGTHAEFQRRGLGRAVMLEGLRRLREWGMTSAKVGTGAKNEPAIRLYQSVGFRIESQTVTYARPA